VALAHLRHAHGAPPHTCGQLAGALAIAVALSLLSALVAIRPQLLAHLRLQHLVQHLLQQLRQARNLLKLSLHRLALDGNLLLWHPVSSVVITEQPDTSFSLRGGAGRFVSVLGWLASRAAIRLPQFPALIGHHSGVLMVSLFSNIVTPAVSPAPSPYSPELQPAEQPWALWAAD
jgi:hypothetical protein